MTTTKRKRAKQEWIDGTKPESDSELSTLAGQLFDVRTERMELTKHEVELADQLIAAMKRKGVEVYDDPDNGIVVAIKHSAEKVSVKRKSSDDAGDDE